MGAEKGKTGDREMKTVTGIFPSATANISLADLWTITQSNGVQSFWTSYDLSLNAFGVFFSSAGPNIKRGTTRSTVGLEVATLDMDIDCARGLITLGTFPLQQAALNKMLDGATIKLERAYMVTPGSVQCTVKLFQGTVGAVTTSASSVHIQVKSITARLDYPWPRNVWSPTCQRRLYSPGCGVLEAFYTVIVTASAGTRFGFSAAHGRPAGYFDLGKATFTSPGPLQGLSMGIKSSTTNSITLSGVLPAPASGQVNLSPGCDKAYTTCGPKFNNLTHFKGEPFIPRPETAR